MEKVITAGIRSELITREYRDRDRLASEIKMERAASGYAEEVGEGLFIGEALQHLDPALLVEMMEYLTKDK